MKGCAPGTRRVAALGVKSLREDIEVAHDTAERWLGILENLYICFRIPPFGAPRIRAVKKERKLYLWDCSTVEDTGPRFENLVASHLLKLCHFVEDTEGHRMELRFLRDTDAREVDFVVLRDRTPLFAVEAKSGDRGVSPAIRYFRERTAIPQWYQVHLGAKDVRVDGVRMRHPSSPGAPSTTLPWRDSRNAPSHQSPAFPPKTGHSAVNTRVG